MPGAWRRLLRNRPLLATCGLLAVLGVGASGFAQATDLRITGVISANWRGAYDILVTSSGHGVAKEAARTQGLIEPDFVAYGGSGGISQRELGEIRSLDGVDVAAPIGFVGYLDSDAIHPTVFVSGQDLPSRPTLYRISISLDTSDGRHVLTISELRQDVLLGPADLTKQLLPIATSDGNYSWDTDGIYITFASAFPPYVNPVEAIDPVAERALLGSSANFLRSLQLPRSKLTAATFPGERIPKSFVWSRAQFRSLIRPPSAPPGTPGGATAKTPVLPIAVSSDLPYRLWASMTVQQIGSPLTHYPPHPPNKPPNLSGLEHSNGGQVKSVGKSTIDIADRSTAFEAADVTFSWPGGRAAPGRSLETSTSDHLVTRLAARASYTSHENHNFSGPAFEISSHGPVAYDGTAPGKEDDTLGAVTSRSTQSYRTYRTYRIAVHPDMHALTGHGSPIAYCLAPVATFRLNTLRLPANPLNHVPLGAYEQPAAELLDARMHATGTALTATANPLGFLTSPPDVITTIQAAEILRGHTPIDAVRVRVAGVDRYDPAAIRHVEDVADRIAALGGLDVRVVAGSSPQQVAVYVPRYSVGGADLGWVQENWTTLGAAQRTSAALSANEKRLLVIALLLSLVLIAATFVADADSKRGDIPAWESLGWSRTRQIWWMSGDALAGAVVVAVATGAGALIFDRGIVVSLLGVGLSFVLCVTGPGVALLLLRRDRNRERTTLRQRGRRRAIVGAGTVAGLAARMLRRHVGPLACNAAATAITVMTLAFFVASTAAGARRAGPTLLAGHVSSSIRALHFALFGSVLVGSLVSIVLVDRVSLNRRRQSFRAAFGAGWPRGQIMAELRIERAAVVVIAAFGAIAGWFAIGSPGTTTSFVAVLAIATAGVYVLGEFSARRFARVALGE